METQLDLQNVAIDEYQRVRNSILKTELDGLSSFFGMEIIDFQIVEHSSGIWLTLPDFPKLEFRTDNTYSYRDDGRKKIIKVRRYKFWGFYYEEEILYNLSDLGKYLIKYSIVKRKQSK